MANKEEKVLNGAEFWDEIEGKKEDLEEKIEINFAGVKGEITVVFRDIDVVQEIEEDYEDEYPEKPQVEFKGFGVIKVPNEDYPQFNDHPKAKEWEKEAKPVEKERIFRTAYEFIKEDERPADNPKEGTKFLQENLRYMDAIKIVNKGMELSGVDRQLEEARKNS